MINCLNKYGGSNDNNYWSNFFSSFIFLVFIAKDMSLSLISQRQNGEKLMSLAIIRNLKNKGNRQHSSLSHMMAAHSHGAHASASAAGTTSIGHR